ncbi:unnamed protein product [Diatraea saccharalis]|uniref:Uncharacterized protein n=1 Tax=Diatraea saccharalis TaxID=40085 RepID=A0A9N9QY79_9NEOP|nr:unnamed protein product [Diatraea saccharalis]
MQAETSRRPAAGARRRTQPALLISVRSRQRRRRSCSGPHANERRQPYTTKAALMILLHRTSRSSAGGESRRATARALHPSHVYPFNAQFPYNLTLRSKRNFPKSFPAARRRSGGGCERDADIGVLEIKCWAKLVTLRLSISKPIRSKVCAKMTSKGNHTLGWRPPAHPLPSPYLNPPCLSPYRHATDNLQLVWVASDVIG